MPRTAILYIAKRCNQNCVFCLEEDGDWAPFEDPMTQEVTAEITRLRGRGAEHITFMGGETFFRKDLGRILAHARKEGFTRVGVTTNGTVLAKPGFVRELRTQGLDFIEFSIHGHTPELSNAIAGTSYTHERQSLALEEIRELGLPTILNVVVCRENKDHLVDIARHVCERHAGLRARFKFKFVSLQGLAARAADVLRYQDVDPIPVGDYLSERGVPFWFYNFPLCRLGRHAAHAHEVGTLGADEQYFDYDHWSDRGYYDSGHQLLGRVWPVCGACTLRPICPGLEDQYRRVCGAGELAARSDDPVPMMAVALLDRGGDPKAAAARVAALSKAPRPAVYARTAAGDPRALEFEHKGEPRRLALRIEPRADEKPAFAESDRFALTYLSWPGEDAGQHAGVAELLAAAVVTLAAADRAGRDLDGARLAVAGISAGGWSFCPPAQSARSSLVPWIRAYPRRNP